MRLDKFVGKAKSTQQLYVVDWSSDDEYFGIKDADDYSKYEKI